jgi:biopolymer transport protein ExbB/TolQ
MEVIVPAANSSSRPPWESHPVSLASSLTAVLLRSPFVWGGAAACAFFALIHGGVITHAGTIRYLAGHWVEYVETAMFCVGLAALVLKSLDVARQRSRLDDTWLTPAPEGGEEPAAATALRDGIGADTDGWLPRRLREALDMVARTGSPEGLEEHLKYLSDLDASRAAQGHGLVKFIIWAIPIMGFLGTVIGITEAIANLSPTQLENITLVVAGLGVAFDTTATALALSMVLMFVQFLLDRSEQRLLAEVDEIAWETLAGRFQSPGGGDVAALAVARLGETVTRSTARLLEAQERAWQGLEQAAGVGVERMLSESGAALRTAVTASLEETLSRWQSSLAQAHAHLTSTHEDRWARAAESLATAVSGLGRHQQSIREQTELLARVVDATRDVTSLERALESNLTTLGAAGRFDETLATLSAAVQLLAARAGDVAEPRRVDLVPARRSGIAA